MKDIVPELQRIADDIDLGATQTEQGLDEVVRFHLANRWPPGVKRPTAIELRIHHEKAIASARTDAQLVRTAADLIARLRGR